MPSSPNTEFKRSKKDARTVVTKHLSHLRLPKTKKNKVHMKGYKNYYIVELGKKLNEKVPLISPICVRIKRENEQMKYENDQLKYENEQLKKKISKLELINSRLRSHAADSEARAVEADWNYINLQHRYNYLSCDENTDLNELINPPCTKCSKNKKEKNKDKTRLESYKTLKTPKKKKLKQNQPQQHNRYATVRFPIPSNVNSFDITYDIVFNT